MAWKVEWSGDGSGPLPDLREAKVVARSRTTVTESGVLALPSGPVAVHRKSYSYAGIGARLSGMFRTTFAAPSRARLEWRALVRLGALGLAPAPVALAEDRVAGFLREAILVTRTVERGANLADATPSADLATAVGRAAGAMHAAGLGDLSLSPRNLVVARRDGAWTVAKVDSGRMREVSRGGAEQTADLADLIAGLEERWSAADFDALRASYAAAAGAIPPGLDGAMVAAHERCARRRPR